MTALSAFPADGYTARWQTWDETDQETLTLRWENEGWTAMGEVGREAVSYVIRMNATWIVSQFLLFRDQQEPDLWLGTDGAGRWGEVNGAHRTELDGCGVVDLACTPFTQTLPIRRLGLEVGDAAVVKAATIDVETLGVVPTEHRYERVGAQRWRLVDLDARSEVEFSVDEYGLVNDLPGAFRRI